MKIRIGKIASWLGRIVATALAQKAVDRLTKDRNSASGEAVAAPEK